MSHRAIALLPVIFVVACGTAAPPAKGPAESAGPTGAASAQPGPADAKPPEAPTTPSPGASAGSPKPDTGEGGVDAAVIDTKEPLGGGTLSQDDIKKILEKNGELFGDCYSIGTGGKMKDLNGTVKVKATLGPNGVVNDVKVLKSDMKNAKVDACVANAFKKIKFPAPKNAGTSVITFPIVFNGLEEVKN